MASFLKICQDVARECGIAGGSDLVPRPVSVVNQMGELSRVVNWVADAYTEIQNSRNWRWLRKDFTFDTVDGTDTYPFSAVTDVDTSAAITRFKAWRLNDRNNPPKLYLTSAGLGAQVFISWSKWDAFEHLYKTGSLQLQTSQPVHITVNTKDEIVLGVTPNDVYTVTGSYFRSAQILALDSDIPEMPEDFHSLIKYQAMEYYGLYESAPEILSRAQNGMHRIMSQLKRNQEVAFRIGGPLA